MKILVTGGFGFVGINLVRNLAQSLKCEVIAADISQINAFSQSFLQPVEHLVRCRSLDVRNREDFRQLVKDESITHIVHAAAITPGEEQERSQPAFVVDVNLVGAINAMAVGYESPLVQRVLVCSSSGVYGAPLVPLEGQQDETGVLQLDSLYAITKYSAELIAERFTQLGSTSMASVRLGSVYGPGEQPSVSRQRVSQVQQLVDALQSGRSLRLYGPRVQRDWVYTTDVAGAVQALLLAPRWSYPVYNIGTGKGIAFEQVIKPFIERGLRVEWVEDPNHADIAMTHTSERAALNIHRLQSDTGFHPRFMFEEGVAEILDSRW